MNILVTGAGSRIGQAVIKLIRSSQKNFSIISTDYFPDSVGFYWSNNFKILPELNINNDSKWLKAIERLIVKNNIKLVIPGIDFELPIFSKYKPYLEKKYNLICLVSNLEEIDKYNNKFNTYKFLKSKGVSVPKTSLLEKKEFFIKENGYPIVIKPIIGSTSKGLLTFNNSKELKNYKLNTKKYIIQEKLSGFEVTSGAIIFNKKIYSLINLKRNLIKGNTHSAILYKNKKIDIYINKIVKVSNFYGPINFQLFYNKGNIKLIEINPRFSGTSFSRSLFGLNEFDIIYSVLFDSNFQKSYKLKKGTIIKYIEDQFIDNTKIIK